MTTTATSPMPSPTKATDDDELTHIFCCDVDRALCLSDISDATFTLDSDGKLECIVCIELEEKPCEVCGQ